jgi:hypothetical protein
MRHAACGMRHGAVAADTAHLDQAGVAAGHRKARHHHELARRLAERVVHAEHRLAGEQCLAS